MSKKVDKEIQKLEKQKQKKTEQKIKIEEELNQIENELKELKNIKCKYEKLDNSTHEILKKFQVKKEEE